METNEQLIFRPINYCTEYYRLVREQNLLIAVLMQRLIDEIKVDVVSGRHYKVALEVWGDDPDFVKFIEDEKAARIALLTEPYLSKG